MDSDDELENRQQPLEPLRTAGERWKQAAMVSTKRRIPAQRWLPFLAMVQTRYPSVKKFEAIENRVQAETGRSLSSQDYSSSDIAERLIAQAEAPAWEGDEINESYVSGLPRRFPSTTGTTPPNVTERLIAQAEAPVQSFLPEVERSSHFILGANLKNFLANLLDIRIPAVKIYTSQMADALTRKQGADALTYQDKIFFRAGKFNPRTVAGMALLGHELTHAAQTRLEPQNATQRVTHKAMEDQALVNEARVLQHFTSPNPSASEVNLGSAHSISPSVSPTWIQQLARPSHSPLTQSTRTTPEISFQGSRHNSYSSVQEQGRLNVPGFPKGNAALGSSFQAPPMQTGQLKAAASDREISLPISGSDNSLNGTPQMSELQLKQIKEEVYRDLMNRIRIEFERGG
jgi:Domain of unknown function (DUF4157)